MTRTYLLPPNFDGKIEGEGLTGYVYNVPARTRLITDHKLNVRKLKCPPSIFIIWEETDTLEFNELSWLVTDGPWDPTRADQTFRESAFLSNIVDEPGLICLGDMFRQIQRGEFDPITAFWASTFEIDHLYQNDPVIDASITTPLEWIEYRHEHLQRFAA